jgi:hypothetical protein
MRAELDHLEDLIIRIDQLGGPADDFGDLTYLFLAVQWFGISLGPKRVALA